MINQDTILLINNSKVSMEDFMFKYGIDSMERAIELAERMVKKNKIKIHVDKTEEDELVEAMEKDELFEEIVNQINEEEYEYAKSKRQARIGDEDLKTIKLKFKTTAEAVNAENWINGLGIEDTEVSIKQGVVALICKGVSDAEFGKISTRYQLDQAINKTVEVTNKAVTGATDAINYGLTKVVAPTAKIAGKAGMNLGKGLIHTALRTGAGLVNSGAQAIEETKTAVATDTEMLKAKKELIDAKDKMIGFFTRGSKRRNKGIEVL